MATVLNGNLVSVADSDFESALTGNWTVLQNCTLSRSTSTAFSGTGSLAVAVTAATPQVQLASINAMAGKGYVASLYVKTPNTGRGCQILVNAYNGGTYLSTLVSTFQALTPNVWTAVSMPITLPATTTKAFFIIQGDGMAGGESFNIDLTYFAQSNLQVLVDWTNNPLGVSATGGNNFVDVTPWVRSDSQLTISRGRQDNISVVQPGRCTFTVENNQGWFTPNNSASPWSPGVVLGRRVQVNRCDEAGNWHTRFDGQIAEMDIDPAITGQLAQAQIVCADVLAYINRFPQFSSWTVEESSLWAQPALQYIMNDQKDANGIADSSGNNGPMLAPYTYPVPAYGTNIGTTAVATPTITYQSGNNPVEGAVEPTFATTPYGENTSAISAPLSSVAFGATITSGTGASIGASAQFQGQLPFNLTASGGNAFTLVAWCWPNVTIANYSQLSYWQNIVALSNSRTGQMLAAQVSPTSGGGGGASAQGGWYSNFLRSNLNATSTSPCSGNPLIWYQYNGPFMVAIVVNGTTANFYVGGNILATGETLINPTSSLTLPSGTSFNFLSIGGPIGGGNGFLGNISNVCVYRQALTTTNLSYLAIFGAHGPMAGASIGGTTTGSTGIAIQRLASGYTQLPSYWQGTMDTGLSSLDYVDLTGSTASTAMSIINGVEKGLYFVDAAGRINYHDRSRRMAASVPAVTLPAGSYNVDIKPKWNDQYLINYESLQNERGGAGVIAQNPTSIDQYGVYPNGSQAAPQTAPYFTWGGGYAIKQVSNPTVTSGVQIYNNHAISDVANWDVNTLGQPLMKLASLTLDMLGNGPGQSEYVAPSTLYGLEINQPVTLGESLAWWPNGPESTELFIEGVTETYSSQTASIMFYTSPAFQARAWQPGSAAYGQLDVNARVGIGTAPSTAVELYPFILPNIQSGDFSASMNAGGGGANGFVGARDLRHISLNLQSVTSPPLLFVQQVNATQSLANNTGTYITWDTTTVDTTQMTNQYTAGAQASIIVLQGWYEIYLTVQFASNSVGDRRIWIVQNQTLGNRSLAVAETRGTGSAATGLTTSVVVYCGAGDALAARALQTSGGALSTAITNGGSHMSLRYLGSGTARN